MPKYPLHHEDARPMFATVETEWWRKTHPNPKPIGRPKKIKEQDD